MNTFKKIIKQIKTAIKNIFNNNNSIHVNFIDSETWLKQLELAGFI